MFLLTAQEMRKVDQTAIMELGIPGLILTENAGLKVVENIREMLGSLFGKRIVIFAGKGNNGGDGFVIARHLLNAGAETKVLLLAAPEELTGDARVNQQIFSAMGGTIFPVLDRNGSNLVKLSMAYADLAVDAVFGTGFKGSASKQTGEIFRIINHAAKPVVAVDIPSGLEADTGLVHGSCIKADRTVTFAYPKLGLVIQQGPRFTGQLVVADISIPPGMAKRLGITRFLTTPAMVRDMMPTRSIEAHKGTFGRILVIGGSRGLSGAAAMTGTAALRAGAGLVTVAVPDSLHSLMEIKLTEVMTKPLSETPDASISLAALPDILETAASMDVLVLGPGMSTNDETRALIRQLVPQLGVPTVVDADGLNAVAGTDILADCPVPLVITPHPGEMARLLGIKTSEVQNNRIETAIVAARRFHAVVVLKGFRTVVADPAGSVYVNPTGNPGMATGGTGDVLTGMIAGLMGQGVEPLAAAVAGTYLHGAAGDLAAAAKGQTSLIAGDLLEYLPTVIREHEK